MAMACALGLTFPLASSAWAAALDETQIMVPEIAGLEVKVGQTVVIQSGAWTPLAFQFADGRISLTGNPPTESWSSDGGRTWQKGSAMP
jgi:hypothetical protein